MIILGLSDSFGFVLFNERKVQSVHFLDSYGPFLASVLWPSKCIGKGLSRPKRVCLKQVSCFTTMYVIKGWRREETCGMPNVSSLLHHFTTYILVKHDTRFKHTRFGLDKP